MMEGQQFEQPPAYAHDVNANGQAAAYPPPPAIPDDGAPWYQPHPHAQPPPSSDPAQQQQQPPPTYDAAVSQQQQPMPDYTAPPPQQQFPGPPAAGGSAEQAYADFMNQFGMKADLQPPSATALAPPPQPQPLMSDVSSVQHPDQPTKQARRNRWGPAMGGGDSKQQQAGGEGDGDGKKKKRRSRWETGETQLGQLIPSFPKELVLPGAIRVVLPPHLTGEPIHSDPKLAALHSELAETTKKLANNDYDIPPEGQRSPSPEPVYDRMGIRLNTREIRYRERMVERRNKVIEELIKEDPNFKPPADYKPQKKWKKIFIPIKEYPGYNFIGLIIGPRGNTQKRMQKETNTKIAIRGKGSVKEGASRDPKYDYGEDEELHVLITGDTQEDVDAAGKMIDELLQPMDEVRNEHKRLQLRELAALNGTLKEEQSCYLCGSSDHRAQECPTKHSEVYQLPEEIQAKVQEQYQRDVARVRPEEAGKMDAEYRDFIRQLGGAPPPEYMGAPADPEDGQPGRPKRPGEDLPNNCKLYVGNLSPAFDSKMLQQMFEPFGTCLYTTVIPDSNAPGTRCFGFVHMGDAAAAAAACEGLHGKVVGDRPLVVRIRNDPGTRRPPGEAPGGGAEDGSRLYVNGVPAAYGEPQLKMLFQRFGQVLECRLIMDKVTGQSKGYAFVTMGGAGEGQAAMRGLNGYAVGDGKQLTVRPAKSNPGGAPSSDVPLPVLSGDRPPLPTVMTPGQRGLHPPGVPGYAPPPGAPPLPSYQSSLPSYPGGPPPVPYGMPPGAYPPPLPASAPPGSVAPPYAPLPPPSMPPGPYPGAPPSSTPAYPPHGAPPPAGHPPPYPHSFYPPPHARPPGDPSHAPPPYPMYPPPAANPPLPSGPAPPLPGAAPQVQQEYERFMSEMQSGMGR